MDRRRVQCHESVQHESKAVLQLLLSSLFSVKPHKVEQEDRTHTYSIVVEDAASNNIFVAGP